MEKTQKYRAKILISGLKYLLSNKDKILDIGCGNGVITKELMNYFDCRIVGTDILDYRNRGIEFDFIKMDKMTLLPFGFQSFDAGILTDVLHHLPKENQADLLHEGLRVCKKLYLFESENTFIVRLIDVVMNWLDNPDIPVPLALRNLDEWIKFFGDNNIRYTYCPIKKPIWIYPVNKYLFMLDKNEKE